MYVSILFLVSISAEGTMVGFIMMAISSRGPRPRPVRNANPSNIPIRVDLDINKNISTHYHSKMYFKIGSILCSVIIVLFYLFFNHYKNLICHFNNSQIYTLKQLNMAVIFGYLVKSYLFSVCNSKCVYWTTFYTVPETYGHVYLVTRYLKMLMRSSPVFPIVGGEEEAEC